MAIEPLDFLGSGTCGPLQHISPQPRLVQSFISRSADQLPGAFIERGDALDLLCLSIQWLGGS